MNQQNTNAPFVGHPSDGLAARALLEGLERVRQQIHEQLSAIDQEVRSRANWHQTETEPALKRRIGELERLVGKLQTEDAGQERERGTMLEQLEHDRDLLAEAWQRVEREQIKLEAASRAATRKSSSRLPAHQTEPSAFSADLEDLVSTNVLRQFESLQRDVRRNAKSRK